MGSLEDLAVRPRDQLTRTMVDDLVAENLQEGFTLEYKRELGDTNSTLNSVAAMANTFGGVVLVGVDEDRSSGQAFGFPGPAGIVGVDPEERSRLISKCYALLVPPYTPEVVALPIEAGKVVLVVRIDPRLAQRPVVFQKRVPVRTDNGNEPADRFRLAELFHEESNSSVETSGFVTGSADNHSAWSDDPPADLIVRLRSTFPIIASGRRLRLFDTGRDALAAALRTSPLDEWLGHQLYTATLHNQGNINAWHQGGHNTSTQLQLRWEGRIDRGKSFPEAHCFVELPLGGSGEMACALDVILRQGMLQAHNKAHGRPDAPKFRLGAVDLLALLRALLDTFVEAIIPTVEGLSLVPTGPPTGPFCFITSHQQLLSDTVQLDNVPIVPGNEPGRGSGGLYLDLNTRLTDTASRWAQASEWLRQTLQDCHYMGVDRFVDELETWLRQPPTED